MGRGRFGFTNFLKGLGRQKGAYNKKLAMGVNPSGMNNYTHIGFTYDEAPRCAWFTQDGSFIAPLDFPYLWPTGSGHTGLMGWNTTTDGSQMVDVYDLGPLRDTVRMALDGTIDMASLVARSITRIDLNLPSFVAYERFSETYQVQFPMPVPGATISGSGMVANSWQSDDGGVGRTWRFTLDGTGALSLKISVLVNSGAVPGMTISRPRIVPHPSVGITKVSPEPVGYPPEVAKLKKVGRFLRVLDLGRMNNRTIGGDTLTALRYRTAEPTDYLFGSASADAGQPYITVAQMVAIANEAGMGLWFIFSHRDIPALCLQHAQTLKALNGPLVVEFGNEVWNSAFIASTETMFEGLRQGFAKVKSSAAAVPETMTLPYRHGTTTAQANAASGDKVITILSGYGTCVFRARRAVVKTEAFPTVLNTNAAYAQNATVIANYPLAAVYIAIQAVPANGNIQITDTNYWRATTDADATLAPWDLYLTSTDALQAREHYRAYMTNFINDAVNSARTAVGKPAAISVINVQVSVTSVRGDATGTNAASNTEPARMLEFDNLWRRNPWVLQSIYLLNDQFPSSQQPWTYSHTFTSGAASVTTADKQLLYSDPTTSIAPINALADKMLSDAMIAFMRSNITTRRITFATGGAYSLQTFLNGQRTAWNAANPGDIVAPIVARVGEYEVGIECGVTGRGTPDEAGNWSSGGSYTSGYAQANFAKVSGALYRCKGTATVGLSPASDSTNWELMNPVLDFDGKTRPRICALANAIYHHPKAYTLLQGVAADTAAYAASAQGGNYLSNVYATIRQMMDTPNSAFGYRFENYEDATNSPAWAAAVDNMALWEALP
jgi:hypothetical protein